MYRDMLDKTVADTRAAYLKAVEEKIEGSRFRCLHMVWEEAVAARNAWDLSEDAKELAVLEATLL